MPQMNLLCVALAVLAAVVSQSLLDFSLFLLGLSWLLSYFYKKNSKVSLFQKMGIEWAFAGYLIVIGLGFLLNSAAGAEIAKSYTKFIWIFNLYLLIYAFRTFQIDLKKSLFFFIFAFLIPNFYALLSYIYGTDPLTGREADRILGLVSSATYHAHGNALIFVFFSSFLFFKFHELSKKMKLIALFSFVIYGCSILLTFTRGIWLSLFLSTLVMSFVLNSKKAMYFLGVSIVTVFLCYSFWPQFKSRIDHSFSVSDNSERMNLFKVNVQIFIEYPLIGIGFGENLRRNREYWNQPQWDMPADYITSHAHNQFLNVMSTTGLFGLFFFCSFFFYFFKRNIIWLIKIKNKKYHRDYILAFTCLWAQIEFFLGCLTDVSFEYAKIRALLIVVWALMIAEEDRSHHDAF